MDLAPSEAEELTDRIRAALSETTRLFVEAHTSGEWLDLGYRSFGEYVRTELPFFADQLEAEEAVVGDGHQRDVYDAAIAFHQISTKRLYLIAEPSFALYCTRRWGISDTTGYRMVAQGRECMTDPTGVSQREAAGRARARRRGVPPVCVAKFPDPPWQRSRDAGVQA